MLNPALLEPEQEELLAAMAEAQRSMSRAERQKFLYLKHMQGAYLLHPGFSRDEDVYEGDLDALADAGLLRRTYASRGTACYDVTPRGYHYYEQWKKSQGEPVERVEQHVRRFLDAGLLSKRYPAAYAKWRDAEDLLWSTDSREQLSKVGHSCREAMIAFVDALVGRVKPTEVDSDRTKFVRRLRAVFLHRAERRGSTSRRYLEALVTYWDRVSDLVQRQEHAALREGEELVWEDGRRVVFQTLLVMYEVDRSLF